MLVITRRIGETVIVGGNVEIMVTEQRSGQVKLGIVAPRSVKVYRKELCVQKEDGTWQPIHSR
jgi:carbon storage regulator